MAAPSLDDKLHDVVKGDDNLISYCHELAADIEKRSLQFVCLVEKLGFALTDGDVALRERGTLVLSYVLQNIPEDFLQENELHFIASFFVDRLKDHHNVIPAVLKGILAIVNMKNLPDEAPSRILSTMFREISCQSQLQSDRRVIYRIIHSSIVNKLEEMKKMGPDLVAGVIQSIDGERDPRNLLFLFNILPTFMENFELGHLTEEMFDVISCYFPVDFSPPANDPNSVTREDLAHLLAQSLVSTTAFAEFCLPLLMEKLDSNIRVAKLDALYVLGEACKKFLLKDLEPHIRELWKCILKEILPGTEKEIQDAAIATLKELISKLSVEITNKEQSKLLPDLLTQVIGASQSLLSEVDSNLFVAVIKLLTASAEASPFACHYIVSRVLPLLIEQCLKKPKQSELSNVLHTITNFLEVCDRLKVSINEILPDWSQCMPGLYLNAAESGDSEGGLLAMEGWKGLTLTVPLLSCSASASLPAQVSLPSQDEVYHLICQTLAEVDSEPIRNSCIECLKAHAKYYPDQVLESVVKKLVTENDEVKSETTEDLPQYLGSLKRRFSAMCELACCAGEPFTSNIIPKVISVIVGSPSSQIPKKAVVGFSCLRNAIEVSENNQEWLCEYLYNEEGAPAVFIKWWLIGAFAGNDSNQAPNEDIFEDPELLKEVAAIISLIVRTLNASIQGALVLDILPLFFHWNVLNENCLKDAGVLADYKPLDESSPWQQTQTVILLEAIIGSLRRDEVVQEALSKTTVLELYEHLSALAIFDLHPPTRLSSARLLGCLINKTPQEVQLVKLLADLKAAINPVLDDSIIPLWQRLSAVKLHIWVTKALLLRGHDDADIWIDRLIGFLGTEAIGVEAANGFHEIMAQSEGYLTFNCHANIRILYRQRFYLTLPKLIDSYKKASLSTKGNFLLALAHLIGGVPRNLLGADLPEVIPLLVESLKQPAMQEDANEAGVIHEGNEEKLLLLSTLETVTDLTSSLNTTLCEHLHTFIPRLLSIARSSKHMEVRRKSLLCIYHISRYPTINVQPFKFTVIQGLAPCLDDPKRLVRREAVKARCQWFLVGAPG